MSTNKRENTAAKNTAAKKSGVKKKSSAPDVELTEAEILGHRHAGEQAAPLRHEAHAAAGDLVRGQARDILPGSARRGRSRACFPALPRPERSPREPHDRIVPGILPVRRSPVRLHHP